jgi:hypothetical protein
MKKLIPLMLLPFMPSFAQAGKPDWARYLEAELRSAVQTCELEGTGGSASFRRSGDGFRLRLEGVLGTPLGSGNTPVWNLVSLDGQVAKAKRGFFGSVFSKNAEAAIDLGLDTDTRVCITGIEVDEKRKEIKASLSTRSRQPVLVNGTQRSLFVRANLEFALGNRLQGMTGEEARTFLFRWLIPEAASSAAEAPESGGAPTLRLGMSFDDVRTAFGNPEKTIDLGVRVVWIYRDLRVTFQDGKVADVQ